MTEIRFRIYSLKSGCTGTEKTQPSSDRRKRNELLIQFGLKWLKPTVSQFTICLEIHQNHCSWQWSGGIQNGGSTLNAAIARLCHGEYALQTGSMALLWASPIRCCSDWWRSLMHLPLITPQSWFIHLVSVTWHCQCPQLLQWKLPAGTFTIIWSPDGQRHQTERTHAAPSHLIYTGFVLEGRWASHCLHSERIPHPEGSAAHWARGVSGSVSLPSEELVRVCVKPIQRTHVQGCAHTQSQNLAGFCLCQPSLWSLSACQVLHKEINPSGERIIIKTGFMHR